jgi:hypothetical protein
LKTAPPKGRGEKTVRENTGEVSRSQIM